MQLHGMEAIQWRCISTRWDCVTAFHIVWSYASLDWCSEDGDNGGKIKSVKCPSKKLVTIIVASAISGLLEVGMTLSINWKRRMKRRALEGMPSGTDDIDLPLYDFATVAVATNHFSQTNKLGAGGLVRSTR
ncbi:hypothetical protein NL676_025531 [Syzygium grande]|nr:hypothetical protein NL676_025531 [Syzygium grande]